jgi:hypothetical protein
VRAFAVTGLASGALDVTASATAFSDNPSSGPAAMTSQANELLVGAITNSFQTVAGAGFSPGTNGTGNICSNTGNQTYAALPGVGTSNVPSLFGMYCIVGALGQYEARGTFGSGAAVWQALLATYKEASPTPTSTPTSTPTVTTTPTSTSTSTPTSTATPTSTSTPTSTATPTATGTPTSTPTATRTGTPTSTLTGTLLPTRTPTPTATPTPAVTGCILGDVNCDGIVDVRDYAVWGQQFGATNCGNVADLNHDCLVDIRDYGIWRQNFGHTAGAAPAGTAAPALRPSSAKPVRSAEAWPYGGARRVR